VPAVAATSVNGAQLHSKAPLRVTLTIAQYNAKAALHNHNAATAMLTSMISATGAHQYSSPNTARNPDYSTEQCLRNCMITTLQIVCLPPQSAPQVRTHTAAAAWQAQLLTWGCKTLHRPASTDDKHGEDASAAATLDHLCG
jgi:hypothetical protein